MNYLSGAFTAGALGPMLFEPKAIRQKWSLKLYISLNVIAIPFAFAKSIPTDVIATTTILFISTYETAGKFIAGKEASIKNATMIIAASGLITLAGLVTMAAQEQLTKGTNLSSSIELSFYAGAAGACAALWGMNKLIETK